MSGTAAVRSPLSQTMNLSMYDSSMSDSYFQHGMAEEYKRAAKLFLNKQFAQALEQTKSILNQRQLASDKIYTKSLKLYFVLIDKTLKGAPGDTTNDPKVVSTLQQDTNDGTLWTLLSQEFGTLDAVPVDVAHGLVSLCVRNCPESKPNADMIEQYLSSHPLDDEVPAVINDDYMRIVDAYVLHILPARNEWDYAREVVQASPLYDDEAKQQLINKLHHMEQEEILRATAEKSGVNHDVCEQTPPASMPASPLLPSHTASPNVLTPSVSATASTAAPTSRGEKKTISQRGLAAVGNYWREKLIEYIRVTPLQYVAFAAMFVVCASSPAIRVRVMALMRQFWAKFVAAARMGLKVSFI